MPKTLSPVGWLAICLPGLLILPLGVRTVTPTGARQTSAADAVAYVPSLALDQSASVTSLRIQNLGSQATRAAVLVWPRHKSCAGDCAGPAQVACSPIIPPGESRSVTLPADQQAGSAVVYALSQRLLSELGLSGQFGRDMPVASLFCDVGLLNSVVGDCQDHLRFHRAFMGGGQFAEFPMRHAVGQPIGVAVTRQDSAGTEDMYLASRHEDVADSAREVRYVAPGTIVHLPNGFEGSVHIQNLGPRCATVSGSIYKGYSSRAYGTDTRLQIGPYQTSVWRLADRLAIDWGTAVLTSTEPVAAVVVTQGHGTISTQPAVRLDSSSPTTWAVPIVHQGPRPFQATLGEQEPPPSASAWITGLSIFNARADYATVRVTTASAGRASSAYDRRLGPYVTELHEPRVAPGRPAATGWASVGSSDGPIFVAASAERSAPDSPRVAERYALPANPVVELPPAAAHGLPAVQRRPTAAGQPGLDTIVVAQNTSAVSGTLGVALDVFADCGYLDTITGTVQAGQAIVFDLDDGIGVEDSLEGSGVVRVTDNSGPGLPLLAVMAEVSGTAPDPSQDMASAYPGVPTIAYTVPVTLPARLALSSRVVQLELPDRTGVGVDVDNIGPERCVTAMAHSDAPWLQVSPTRASLPTTLEIVAQGLNLPAGATAQASVTVSALSRGVLDSPQTIQVTVSAPAEPRVLLPHVMSNSLARARILRRGKG